MSRRIVSTLIIDLDNTIFDWQELWQASFAPIFTEIVAITGLPVAQVEEAIRKVHQRRRTSEYTFLIEDLDLLNPYRSNPEVIARLREARSRSKQGRDGALKLYPTVLKSLWDIKKKGTQIIAYTESMAFYSAYRLKRFGLDGVIDVLFSPADHELPDGVSVEQLRSLPDEFYELQVTETRHTPPGELKPNPVLLNNIIDQVGADKSETVYVGDSLYKDVAMAQAAGVIDIHAKYGEGQRLEKYNILRRVSHWSEADVQREKQILEQNVTQPGVVLGVSFEEIFRYFSFKAPVSSVENDEEKNVIEIWKKCVDVHQHFNDLEMRIRNFAITVVSAIIAALSFTYKEGLVTTLFGVSVPAGLGLVAAAIFAWGGFFLMDRYWYHILLRGAVQHSASIESRYGAKIPGIGLGTTISSVSGNVKIFGFKVNSNRRLELFYAGGMVMLVIIFVTLLASHSTNKPDLSGSSARKQTTPAASP